MMSARHEVQGGGSGTGPRRTGYAAWIRWVAALGCALALGVLLLSSRLQVSHDVRVMVPIRVQAGDPLPVRVLVFGDLQRAQGPRLLAPAGRAQLFSSSGVLLAKAALRVGLGPSLEGSLEVPRGTRGRLRLRVAVGPVELPTAELDVPIAAYARVQGGPPNVRPLPELQRLRLGPPERLLGAVGVSAVEEVVPARAPEGTPRSAVDGEVANGQAQVPIVRVAGGVCVPERVCDVFVAVPEQVTDIELEPGPAVTLVDRMFFNGPPALLRQRLRIRGPEAVVHVGVRGGDGGLKRRELRLPVALGTPALAPRRESVFWTSGAPALDLVDVQGRALPCVIDLWQQGRWVGTWTGCGTHAHREAVSLPSGVLRLQLRSDPLSGATAAAVRVGVGPVGVAASRSSPAIAATQVASPALLDSGPLLHTLAAEMGAQLPDPAALSPNELDLFATFLAAYFEGGVLELPPAVGDRGAAVARLARQRRRLAGLVLVAVALSGAAIVLQVARGGLAAAGQAQALLRDAGTTPVQLARDRRKHLWSLGLSLLALLLAFLAIALYVVLRTGLMY